MKSKKGFEMDLTGWAVLGIAGLLLILAAMMILSGKLTNAGDYIKHLFGFRS